MIIIKLNAQNRCTSPAIRHCKFSVSRFRNLKIYQQKKDYESSRKTTEIKIVTQFRSPYRGVKNIMTINPKKIPETETTVTQYMVHANPIMAVNMVNSNPALTERNDIHFLLYLPALPSRNGKMIGLDS